MPNASWPEYLSSLGDELLARSRRVRQLIGDRHWLSDGRHKEDLLASLLRRHLPGGILASRGFVLHPRDPQRVSREQDLLLIDTHRDAPVFRRGGLVVTFPSNVLACVSVKTRMSRRTVREALAGLATVVQVAGDVVSSGQIWCGGFFFEQGLALAREPARGYDHLEEGLRRISTAPRLPPAFPDVFCTARDLAFLSHPPPQSQRLSTRCFRGYACRGTATALFLGRLLAHLSAARGRAGAQLPSVMQSTRLAPLDPPERAVGFGPR